MTAAQLRVVAVDGSPSGGGRTAAALRAVLDGAGGAGASAVIHHLGGDTDPEPVTTDVEQADLVLIGSPTFRASFSAPLKQWFDGLPRGPHPADRNPLAGQPVAVVMTGGSWHHFLGQLDLASLLTVTFAALVVPPGLYLTHQEIGPDGRVVVGADDQARSYGARSAELADALRGRSWSAIRPQI